MRVTCGGLGFWGVLLWVLGCSDAWGRVIYVDDSAPGGNGRTWATAYRFLQDGIAAAEAGDEVRVGQGLYRPDRSEAFPEGTGDIMSSFILAGQMSLRGGFAGLGETDPNVQDPNLYPTTLSGDLAGDDAPVEDASALRGDPTRADNALNVLVVSGWQPPIDELYGQQALWANATAVEGISVSGGSNSRSWVGGGGVRLIEGHVVIKDCLCKENRGVLGGGLYAGETVSVRLISCRFFRNAASFGGAVCLDYDRDGSEPYTEVELIDCTLYGNSGGLGGGLCAIIRPSLILRDCIVTQNSASEGGGLYLAGDEYVRVFGTQLDSNYADRCGGAVDAIYGESIELSHCLFLGNGTPGFGGAIAQYANERMILNNCTAHENWAQSGRLLGGTTDTRIQGDFEKAGSVAIQNCILDNDTQEVDLFGREFELTFTELLEVAYSNIHDADAHILYPGRANVDWGPGNRCWDPGFVDPGYWDDNGTPEEDGDDIFVAGDYHLKSQAGRWEPTSQMWVVDEITSPCIDAGDPNDPIGLETIPHGGRVNMGAYGGTAEASQSYQSDLPPEPNCFDSVPDPEPDGGGRSR